MSQELEQFKDIIEQLKPVVYEPDFNQIVDDTAKGVPRPHRHILKLELRRQARPCKHAVDMRKIEGADCQPFEHDKIIHYLTASAQDVFERQIRAFGQYTVGVYEAVMEEVARFKQNGQANLLTSQTESVFGDTEYYVEEDDDSPDKYLVPAFQFANSAHRSEERMNFTVRVELQTGPKTIKATTMDMSVSGIKIKAVTEHEFSVGEQFAIFFRGLEVEFSLDRKNGVRYQVVKTEKIAHEHHVALKRDIRAPDIQFDEFLRRFIQGNKRRYKVNIDNTLHAIRSKSYEQYYVPYFGSIPIFIESVGTKMQCRYVLTNDNNKDHVFYWVDDSNQLLLSQALTPKRLTDIYNSPLKEAYLYSFNHYESGQVFFYSATHIELRQKKAMQDVFFAFGSKKASWRVFKIQMTGVKPEQCYRPLSIPDSVGESVKEQNSPPAPRLMAALNKISHVVLLTNVTDSLSNQAYQRRQLVDKHLPILKNFAHDKTEIINPVALYRFKYQNLRAESRFQLRSKVIVTFNERELEGVTEDVSPSGLSIELKKTFEGVNFSVVEVAFPELQRMTKQIPLKELPYEVRNISKDKTIINLKIFQESETIPHSAHIFFTELLKNNKNKLKSDTEHEGIPGMGEALRNIYCSNVLNIGYYIIKDGATMLPHAMTEPSSHHRLKNLFSFGTEQEHTLNCKALFSASGDYSRRVFDLLKGLKSKAPPVMEELFIAFEPDALKEEDTLRGQYMDQFRDDHARRAFIVEAMSVGVFYAVKVFVSRTGRPDQDILRTELGYVSVYAAHKAKELEEELWNICGAGDIVDITDEVMRRYGFTDQHIEQNQKQDKQILLAE